MVERVVFSKQCFCKAGASGPRIVTASSSTLLGEITFRATMVAYACDECDEEWIRTEVPGGEHG